LDYIRKEIHGGVSLKDVTAQAGARSSFSSTSLGVRKDYSEAKRNLIKIEVKHKQSSDLPDKIKMLEEQIAAAEAAEKESIRIVSAINYLKNQNRLVQLEEKEKTYSVNLSLIEKRDPEKLAELEKDFDETKKHLHDLQRDADTASKIIIACKIPEAVALKQGILEYIKNLRESLQTEQSEFKTKIERLNQAKMAEEKWQADHLWWISQKPEETSVQAILENIQDLSSKTETVRCRLIASDNYCNALGPEEDCNGPASSAYADLLIRLRDWVDADAEFRFEQTGMSSGQVRNLIWITAVTVILSGILAITMHGAFSFLGLVIILFVLAWSRKSKDFQSASIKKSAAEEKIQALGMGCPSSWDLPDVISFISQTAKRKGEVAALENLNQQRIQAADMLSKAKLDQVKLYAQIENVAKELNLRSGEPQIDGAILYHYVGTLMKWYDLRSEADENEEACKNANESQHRVIDEVLKILTDAKFNDQKQSTTGLTAALDTLENTIISYRQAHSKYLELLNYIADAQTAEDKLNDALDVFWKTRKIEHDSKETLKDLCSKLDDYHELLQDIKITKRDISNNNDGSFNGLLAANPSLQNLLERKDILEKEIQASKGLRTALGEKRNELSRLRDGDELAKAYNLEAQKKVELEEARMIEVENRMVHELCTYLKEESRDRDQPLVLRHANDLLRQFTNNRYNITVDPENGYLARDMVRSRLLTLQELSSGTKVQLLLSVRLAFIRVTEGEDGIRLPLFLDEVLANSDDERAGSIAKAVAEIAKERQVFYFTAQIDEVHKLINMMGDVRYQPVNLAKASALFAVTQRPLTNEPVIASPPVPEPIPDYVEYGRNCKVPGADIWLNISGHHSWHILDNSSDLHALMLKGLVAIGQLPIEYKSRIKILDRVQELARQGRGKYLEPFAFENAEINGINKGSTYYLKVCDLIRGAKGDGKNVYDGLESIPRLNLTVKEAIQGWLIDERYVSHEPVMDDKSILHTILKESTDLTTESQFFKIAARWLANCHASGLKS
jgi:hypothetical protein